LPPRGSGAAERRLWAGGLERRNPDKQYNQTLGCTVSRPGSRRRLELAKGFEPPTA
jgi:hypothetical protein